jgi:hypothetical protein
MTAGSAASGAPCRLNSERSNGAERLLRHHPDLLRQRGAASRARALDDGRRRAGAAHAAAGEDVFFLTGTDEHGEPIENAASARR